MIIFYGEGRLGNQVFQYQALSGLAEPGEIVAAAGLEDLSGVFATAGPRLRVLTRHRLTKRLWKYLVVPFVLRPIARNLRLINYACESEQGTPPHRGPSGELIRQRGLISRFTFVDGGHYHGSGSWDRRFPANLLRIHTKLIEAASAQMQLPHLVGKRAFFVHVRRGDYVGHSAYGVTDLVLPPEFFHKGIAVLREQFDRIHFLFVTEDVAWVEKEFADLEVKSIVNFSAEMDFVMMACCSGGIISNSTFSLAAALFIDAPELIIAPLYWFGFRVGMWLPPNIRFNDPRITYLPVQSSIDER